MKILDVNVLIYAHNAEADSHERARAWFEDVMSGSETVGFPWLSILGFVRLTTRSAIMSPPLSLSDALERVDEWLAQPCATVVHPTRRHPTVLRELLTAVGVGGNRVSDAHLAALAVEHGATLCSRDQDFRRFPGLTWLDPVTAR